MKQVTWVHLSDIHVGSRGDDGLLKRIFGNLKKDIALCSSYTTHPSFLLITGDLAMHALKEEYSKLKVCLDSLPKHLSKLPIFTIPGNHDVNWPDKDALEEHKWLRRYLTERGKNSIRESANEILRPNSKSQQRKQVNDLFSNYNDFFRKDILAKLKKNGTVKTGFMPGDILFRTKINGIKLAIAGFNSTWRHYKKGQFKQRISIIKEQVDYLLPEGFELSCEEDHVRLLLQHHPPEWLDTHSNAPDWENYIALGADAVLNGHLHEDYSSTKKIKNYDPVSVIQASSLCGSEKYGKNELDRKFGYTFCALLWKGNYIHLRKFPRIADKQFRFKPAPDAGQDPSKGVLVTSIEVRETKTKTRVRKSSKRRVTMKRSKEDEQCEAMPIDNSNLQLPSKIIITETYHELLPLSLQKGERNTEDRIQFQLLVAGWEAVCKFTNYLTAQGDHISTSDEMFLHLLGQFVLQEKSSSVSLSKTEILNSFATKPEHQSDVTIDLMRIILTFYTGGDRAAQVTALQAAVKKIDVEQNKTKRDALALLWAPCAINAAIRTNSDKFRDELFTDLQNLLKGRNERIALHLRGLADKIQYKGDYASFESEKWKKIRRAKDTTCTIHSFAMKLKSLNQELDDNAQLNLDLDKFEIICCGLIRPKLVTRIECLTDYMPIGGSLHVAGEPRAREFINLGMEKLPYIIDTIACIIGEERAMNKDHPLFMVSEEIMSTIEARSKAEDFKNYGKDYKEQADLHTAQAVWVIGRHDSGKKCRHSKSAKSNEFKVPDQETYLRYMMNNYWTPEQVLIDLCHTFKYHFPKSHFASIFEKRRQPIAISEQKVGKPNNRKRPM